MKSALFMLLALALETVFIIIKLKHYQKTLRNIPIILTDFEVKGFKDKKWLETREKNGWIYFKNLSSCLFPSGARTIN